METKTKTKRYLKLFVLSVLATVSSFVLVLSFTLMFNVYKVNKIITVSEKLVEQSKTTKGGLDIRKNYGSLQVAIKSYSDSCFLMSNIDNSISVIATYDSCSDKEIQFN